MVVDDDTTHVAETAQSGEPGATTQQKVRKEYQAKLKQILDGLESLAEEQYVEYGLIVVETNPPPTSKTKKHKIVSVGKLSSHLTNSFALNEALLRCHKVRSSNTVPESPYFLNHDKHQTKLARFIATCQRKMATTGESETFSSKYNESQCPDWWSPTLWRNPTKMSLPFLYKCLSLVKNRIVERKLSLDRFENDVRTAVIDQFPTLIAPPSDCDIIKFIKQTFKRSVEAPCTKPDEVAHLVQTLGPKDICILSHVEVIQGGTLACIINNILHRNLDVKIVLVVFDPAAIEAGTSQTDGWSSLDYNVQSLVHGGVQPLHCSILSKCNVIIEADDEESLDDLPKTYLDLDGSVEDLFPLPTVHVGLWDLFQSLNTLHAQFNVLLRDYTVTSSCDVYDVCPWQYFISEYGTLQRPHLCTKLLFRQKDDLVVGLKHKTCDGCKAEVSILKLVCEKISVIQSRLNVLLRVSQHSESSAELSSSENSEGNTSNNYSEDSESSTESVASEAASVPTPQPTTVNHDDTDFDSDHRSQTRNLVANTNKRTLSTSRSQTESSSSEGEYSTARRRSTIKRVSRSRQNRHEEGLSMLLESAQAVEQVANREIQQESCTEAVLEVESATGVSAPANSTLEHDMSNMTGSSRSVLPANTPSCTTETAPSTLEDILVAGVRRIHVAENIPTRRSSRIAEHALGPTSEVTEACRKERGCD